MASYEPTESVLRGLDILRVLNERGAMSVGELRAATGMPKPTIVRMIGTLQHAGYVGPRSPELRYTVTARVLQLSNGYNEQDHLLMTATPLLDRFREQVVWPVEIGIFDQDAMVILHTSRRPGVLSVNRRAGSRVPLLRTSLGKAYLGALLDEQLQALRGQLADFAGPDFELARNPKRFWSLIKQVRRDGYGYSDRETISNGRTIAAPIRRGDLPIGSVNIVILASAMSMQEIEAKFGPRIIELSKRIARQVTS